ncbi:YbgA family protein [Oleidesulfovibrio sp.]|uniref:YbgA family protein n=1 Tax=Oleidesulfovibrio sp. TaxID=2909707 RepID=UPI003A8C7E3C
MSERIRIGISSCLLGNQVRHDGGHKFDSYIVNVLGRYLEFVPVCPEVECGLPTPREPMRLAGDVDSPRLMTSKTWQDKTDQMQDWARKKVSELESEDLCGFIFKRASPSSGMERVKVYPFKNPQEEKNVGAPVLKGVGIFAREFMERFPLLPVEEEGRLNDPLLRENFIERLFVVKRWRDVLAGGLTAGAVVEFHTRHKLLLLAHSQEKYREMGRLVAAVKEYDLDDFRKLYEEKLMQTLAVKPTPRKHANVQQHIMGYFRKQLTTDEKQELLEVIELHRTRVVPLVVPVTLLNHYVRKYGEPYLAGQYYLNPHPIELKLRNHI